MFKKGGVCIFTHETIHCSEINLNKFCKEKDFEICAIELHLQFYKICIMTIYRSPSGDFQYFINTLEMNFMVTPCFIGNKRVHPGNDF